MGKVLIITYYWPPSGGGGVQRWLKFSKCLPEFGWEPTVFTPENPDFPTKDKSLLEDVPNNLEVIRFPIWEPYNLFDKASRKFNQKREQGIVESTSKDALFSKAGKWVRGNVFIPDPKVFWVRPSINFLKDFIVERKINYIITTGPPHSMHLIGLKLKKKTGIKWIADFRDPWVRWDMLREFHLSWWAKSTHERLEKAVMKNADKIVSVSNTWAHEIEVDHAAVKPIVITNGYDEDDFLQKSERRSEKFILSHTGLINKFRNPTGLWEAISQLCEEQPEIADSLQMEFSGILDKNVIDTIQSYKYLQSRFRFLEYLSHDDVIDQYKSSSVLLLLLNKSENGKGHLPGKLFEYLAAKRHILALGNINGDASKIIRETKTGIICDPEDTESIKLTLNSFFSHFKNLNFPDPINLEQYSRRSLTKKLADVLDKL